MAAIIKLSQNEWVKYIFVQMVGEGSVSEVIFVQMMGTNPGKCEWLWGGKTKMAESKMGRIQDGCHHQVEWEWISLSQNE